MGMFYIQEERMDGRDESEVDKLRLIDFCFIAARVLLLATDIAYEPLDIYS